MNSIQIVCTGCRTRLKVPSSVPAGKKVKCPKCGAAVSVPSPVGSDLGYAVAEQTIPAISAPRTTPAAPTKACPYCSEQIMASAVKCRYCGEFLNADKASAATSRSRAPAESKDELTPAEYLVATIFCPIGLAIGLFWSARKFAKAKQMIQVSALSCIIVAAGGLLFRTYYHPASDMRPTIPEGLVLRPDENGPPGYVSPDELDSRGSGSLPPGARPDIKAPSAEIVASQAPHIQRALKATVCILTASGLGTGVIIQRDGDKAWVITNKHVVDPMYAAMQGFAQSTGDLKVKVKFVTNENIDGKVVWKAPDQIDLALVEVSCPKGVEHVSWQSQTDVQFGDQVFAVGNPQGLGWTTTFGKVSALRDHDYGSHKVSVVQTDTRIGPGNSGGGLFTEKGELIGINTFVVAGLRANAGETGLGFAIRKGVLNELKPEVLHASPSGANP